MVKKLFILFVIILSISLFNVYSKDCSPDGQCSGASETCDCANPANHCAGDYFIEYSDQYGSCKNGFCVYDLPSSISCNHNDCSAECGTDFDCPKPGDVCAGNCKCVPSNEASVFTMCATLNDEGLFESCGMDDDLRKNNWPVDSCGVLMWPNTGFCLGSPGEYPLEGGCAEDECLWRDGENNACVKQEHLYETGIACLPLNFGDLPTWGVFADADAHETICEANGLYGSSDWFWAESREDKAFGEYEAEDYRAYKECCGDDKGELPVSYEGEIYCCEKGIHNMINSDGTCGALSPPACQFGDDQNQECCSEDSGQWFNINQINDPNNVGPCCSTDEGEVPANSFDYKEGVLNANECCFAGNILEEQNGGIVNSLYRNFYCHSGQLYVCSEESTYNMPGLEWDFADLILEGENIPGLPLTCCEDEEGNNYFSANCGGIQPTPPGGECVWGEWEKNGCGNACGESDRLYYKELLSGDPIKCGGPQFPNCIYDTSCCEIKEAYWEDYITHERITEIEDGRYVNLIIEGNTACTGKDFEISIYERDSGEDELKRNFVDTFDVDGILRAQSFHMYWEEDGYGDPEFYFTAIHEGPNSVPPEPGHLTETVVLEIESPELTVYKEPCYEFYKCGEWSSCKNNLQTRTCQLSSTPDPECESFNPITNRKCGEVETPFPSYGLIGSILTVILLIGYYIYKKKKFKF